MNKFEKVSFEQYKADLLKYYPSLSNTNDLDNKLQKIYDDIKLPERGTRDSAGYDFFLPHKISIDLGGVIIVPTGIRCQMDSDLVLKLFPRSGHGFKYHMVFANTVGIIDADYYNSSNEGHIMIEIIYDGFATDKIGYISIDGDEIGKPLHPYKTMDIPRYLDFDKGTAICQGIFTPFHKVVGDEVDTVRDGGFGSTDNK